MSNIIAIVGESGSGKSTSMRNLDPKTTVVLSPIDKPFPFRSKFSKKEKNYFGNLNAKDMIKLMNNISEKGEAVKTIVIDDFQYLMAVEFMNRSAELGYQKFTDIGKNAYDVIRATGGLRDNLNIYFLSHLELSDNTGKSKIKTIGKMLDDKITLEGLFTIVLFTKVESGGYSFVTQSDGSTTAKSPMGMFDEEIDNDLALVDKTIREYYREDEEVAK